MKTIAKQLNIKEFPFEIRDDNGNVIYHENSTGYWFKYEYDSNNNQIYFENNHGDIIDKRPKSTPEYTMEELTKLIGKEFKIKK